MALLSTAGWWLLPLGKAISNDDSKGLSDTFHPLHKIPKFWDLNISESLKECNANASFLWGKKCKLPRSNVNTTNTR